MNPAPQLAVLNVLVADMPRALRFYRALGLDIPADADREQHAEITAAAGLALAWDTHDLVRSYDPAWQRGSGGGTTLEFWLPRRADVDATFHRLVDAGYRGHREPFDASWGLRYAVVEDPDANLVALGGRDGPSADDEDGA